LLGGRSPFPITCASGPSADEAAPRPGLKTSVASDAVLAAATVGDPLVDGVAGSWADAPAEPVTADAGA
jgi:hypothetical protein